MVYTVTTTAAQDQVMAALLNRRAQAGDPITADALVQLWATHPLRAALNELRRIQALQREQKADSAPPDVQVQVKALQDQIDTLLANVQPTV